MRSLYNNGNQSIKEVAMTEEEVWKEIDFTDKKYEISNFGRVRSYARSSKGEIIKGRDIGGGYLSIDCKINGTKKSFYVHRLVAQHFLEKPSKNANIVIHKDGDKSNNHLSNLEWCSLRDRFETKRKYLPNYSEAFVQGCKKSQKTTVKPQDGHDYFEFGSKYHRVSDNGSCLFIRVNMGGKWKSLALAEIVLERIGIPKPSPQHKLAYKDWNYKNLNPANLFWETQAEKSRRLLEARPLQLARIRKMGLSHRKNIPSKKKELIKKYLDEGKSIAKISRLLDIGYTRLYNYINKSELA
ncbi:NUMOD4 domain-containing protein [Limibacter armeniacum]|uniref:NUMOD4 domain-containing protein n=1 Tax=Limibacter armeniacum TaxID=466084 RepID=UPI002FE62873